MSQQRAPGEQLERRVENERVGGIVLRARDDARGEIEHLLVGELADAAALAFGVDVAGVDAELDEPGPVVEGGQEIHEGDPKSLTLLEVKLLSGDAGTARPSFDRRGR